MLILEQKAAADALGITPRSLRDWMKEPGFPDCSAGYDIDEIKRWRDDRAKKGSELGDQAKKLKVATAAQKLRFEKARADAAEREERAAQGNILPRDELETAVAELISLARDRLSGVPKSLSKFLPKTLHRRFQDEATKEVQRILNELADSLDRTLETPDE